MNVLPDFDALWNYDDPAATEAAFVKLLPQFERSGDTGKYVELVSQIARTHSLRGEFAEARAGLDSVVPLLGMAGPRAHMRCLLERGRAHNSAGEPAVAVPLFEQAWEIGLASGEDRLAIDAAHMLAIASPTESALSWTEKALAVVERTSDQSAKYWKGPLYNNFGWTYLDAGRNDEALDAFQKSLEFRLEQSTVKPIRIARYTVARAFRSLGRIDDALAILQPLHAEWLAENFEPPYVNEEIGECLLLKGARPADAAPYFAHAFEALSKDSWLAEHEPKRLARLRELGGGVG